MNKTNKTNRTSSGVVFVFSQKSKKTGRNELWRLESYLW